MGEVSRARGHAFISYVREDSSEVDGLQRVLEAAGIQVWRDTKDLWPGEDWRAEVRNAITDDALVFIACFSHRSVARVKSYQNEELNLAIEQLRLRPPDVPWLIPVRFDDCSIPDQDIGGGRTLNSIQRADLFGDRRGEAETRLIDAVRRILRRPGQIAGTRPAPTSTEQQLKDARDPWAGQAGVSQQMSALIRTHLMESPQPTNSGCGPGRQPLPAGRSPAGRRPAVNRRTIVLGGLTACAAAAVPAALILSRPARSSASAPSAALIIKDGEQLFSNSAVEAVAFRPHHSTTLASGSSDGTIRLWDTATAAPAGTLLSRGPVGEIAFSPDGKSLASGDDGGPVVLLWDMTTRRPTVLPGQVGRVFTVAFSRDGTTLASGSPGTPITVPAYHVQLWDVASRRPTTGFLATFPVHAVAFNRDGHMLAYAGGDAGVYPVQLRNLATGKTTTYPGHTGIVNAVGFSPGGNTLASASDDKTIRLWNVTTGESAILRGHTGAIASLAFSPSGKTLATGSADFTARLWDLASKTTIAIYRGHTNQVTSVAFSPDGTTLASGSYDTTIRLWRIP